MEPFPPLSYPDWVDTKETLHLLRQDQPGAPLLAHVRHRGDSVFGRQVDQPPQTDSVTREAYSREVFSAGFWFGDDNFPEPAFYSYTAPEPEGLADEPLQPNPARWVEQHGNHLAVLRYETARNDVDPRSAVLAFLESAYLAGARRAGWDVDRVTCPNGRTDPVLSGGRV